MAESADTYVETPPPAGPGAVLVEGTHVRAHLARAEDVDVYEVWNELRQCHCIAKMVRSGIPSEEAWRERLLEEGAVLDALSHPNIVRLYESHSDPGLLLLEKAQGFPLTTLLHDSDSRRYLVWTHALALAMQLASALDHVHRCGYVYLDLKAPNILVDGGQLTLVDFGHARAPGQQRAGLGSARYMAPEQALGGEMTPATDVWGLGVIMFELLTCGLWPFAPSDTEHPQLAGAAWSVADVRRVPRPLAAFVDGCLRIEPADRPSLTALRDLMLD
jgi:serine/threonine protein kinase